jgi:hypothetical protein
MMGAMSQDQQAGGVDPEVVEWGDDDPTETPERDRTSFADIAGDPRVVTLAAALGGLALFGSLVSEWQITSIDGVAFGAGEVGIRPLTVGLVELGAWGGGYLAGLFVLVASTVLMIFGPPAGRAYARLVTLSTGGMLLALLAAMLMELGENTRALSIATVLNNQELALVLAYGRGGYCAVAGVLAVTLAAVLAGRHLPAPVSAVPAVAVVAVEAGAPESPEPDDEVWRRPPDDDDDDDRAPDAPYQLEVSATTPFTPPADVHDSYRRPDPISG